MSKSDSLFQDTPARILLNKSLKLIERELTRYASSEKLDPHELRSLNDFAKTLVSIDRNDRLSDFDEDLGTVRDEDIQELAKKAAINTLSKDELLELLQQKEQSEIS